MCTLFLYTQLHPKLAVLKICMIFQVFCSCFLLIFSNILYNTRNRSNNKTEHRQEKKPVLMLIFSTVSQKSRD